MQSGTHVGGTTRVESAPDTRSRSAASGGDFDVGKLFATTCGWCHLGGGRHPGKGSRLMGTESSDAELIARIRNGKVGQMPAFRGAFTDEQLQAIVAYIRNLKPEPQAGQAK